MVTLLYPPHQADISLMTDVQKEFIRRERAGLHKSTTQSGNQLPYYDCYTWLPFSQPNKRDFTTPSVLVFRWKNDEPTRSMQFSLSVHPDFAETESTAAIASCSNIMQSCEEEGVYFLLADNLLTDTTYYWKVDDGSGNCEIRSFTTLPNEIRNIRVEGGSNIRDIGGRITAEGNKIRQGLLYRGGQLDNRMFYQYMITENGKNTMRCELGIRTELELRIEAVQYGISDSTLGADTAFYCIPLHAYEGTLEKPNTESLVKIFSLLADESIYPMYMHCTAGADRTGTVALYLLALLGMSEEDIILDYNITALSRYDIRCWTANLRSFTQRLNMMYPDHPFPEQAVLHLRHIGIPEETLAKIRSIFLEM